MDMSLKIRNYNILQIEKWSEDSSTDPINHIAFSAWSNDSYIGIHIVKCHTSQTIVSEFKLASLLSELYNNNN